MPENEYRKHDSILKSGYNFQNISLLVSTIGLSTLLAVMIMSAMSGNQEKEPRTQGNGTKTQDIEFGNLWDKAKSFWMIKDLQILFLVSFASVVLGHQLRIPGLLLVYIFFGVSFQSVAHNFNSSITTIHRLILGLDTRGG